MSPRATIVDYWSDCQSSYPPRIWRVNTNLEDTVMGSLVGMNSLKLLDWDLHIAEASRGEVRGLELRKCLRVKLCLELLEDIRELCKTLIQFRLRYHSRILLTQDQKIGGTRRPPNR